MLLNQISKKLTEGFTPFVFRKGAGDVARHWVGSSSTYFPMDSGQLFLR